MYLERLTLINYRNYDKLDIVFGRNINVLAGHNAQGKTNIIEVIYFLSTAKSHRTARDKDLIMWNKDTAYIKGEYKNEYDELTIEARMDRTINKKIRVNGIVLDRTSDLIGNIKTVIFSPEDLKLVKEGPSERRRYIDNEISQIKPSYYYNLLQYKKVLQQRNNLLKDIKLKKSLNATLDIWDKQLIEYGAYIIFWRKVFISKLLIPTRLIHRKITEGNEEIQIKYEASFNIDLNDDIGMIKEKFNKQLLKNKETDLFSGTTNMGPHRDDIGIFVNNIEIKHFGSQGQQRTAALSLKLAELQLVKNETGEYPILLLDDVMSELDEKRRMFLISSLEKVQLFITTTHIEEISGLFDYNHIIYGIKKGRVSRL